MKKLPLLFLVATLLLVAGASAEPAFIGDAYSVGYSDFTINVDPNFSGAGSTTLFLGWSPTPYPGSYANCDSQTVTNATTSKAMHCTGITSTYWGTGVYTVAMLAGGSANWTDEHTVYLLAGSIFETGAQGVTSNRFNVSAHAINGSEVWFEYGSRSGIRNWKSPVWDVTDVNMDLTLEGAPMYGGETVYYTVCDATGCTAENSTTLSAVTTIPTIVVAKQLWTNITRNRFSPTSIGAGLLGAYTAVAPTPIAIGAAAMFLLLGFWFRTKTARTALMIGVLLAAFLASASSGLMLGLPVIWSAVAVGILAAVMAGIVWSVIHR